MNFYLINGKIVHDILLNNFNCIYDLVEKVYISYAKKLAINCKGQFIRFDHNEKARIISLPAYLKGDNPISGIKWISSYPDNVKKGFPRASAVIILNDYNTGYPVACMEGSIISAARTAASAVLGAYYLNKNKKIVKTIGFVGSGIIAKYIAFSFKKTHWDIGNINLFDIDRFSSEKLKLKLQLEFSDLDVEVNDSLEDLCKTSDIIVFATNVIKPYIKDKDLFYHNPIILNISLRDLDPNIILNSFNITDDVDNVLSENTSLHLTYIQSKKTDFLHGTISDLIEGSITVAENKPRIFSPMGLGVLDLAVSQYIFDETVCSRVIDPVDGFFYEVER